MPITNPKTGPSPAHVIHMALVGLLWVSNALSQTNLSPSGFNAGRPAPNLPLREIEPGLFEMGKVRLDKTRHVVSFPAAVNLREGLLEYLVVADYGKTHESLLRTQAEPYHIHLACLLLGAKGAGTNAFPQANPSAIAGEKVKIELSWTSADQQVRLPAEDMVLNHKARSSMKRGPWVYNGSRVVDGTYLPQASGSIISLILDEASLINNPRPDADNDEIWTANTEKDLPPLNWPVTVLIQLPKPAPTPGSTPDPAPAQKQEPPAQPPQPER